MVIFQFSSYLKKVFEGKYWEGKGEPENKYLSRLRALKTLQKAQCLHIRNDALSSNTFHYRSCNLETHFSNLTSSLPPDVGHTFIQLLLFQLKGFKRILTENNTNFYKYMSEVISAFVVANAWYKFEGKCMRIWVIKSHGRSGRIASCLKCMLLKHKD